MATSKKIIDIANSLDFVNDYNNIGITGNNARISTSEFGELLLYSTSPSVNGSTGTIVLYNGGLSINSTRNSSSITSGGAMTIMGGVSIFKNLLIGGNIGIGTSNPTVNLDVNGSGQFTNIISTNITTTNLLGTSITTTNINVTGNIYQNGSLYVSSSWNQYTNGNLVYTSGNVGIATSSPVYKFDVNGTGRLTNVISTTSTTNTLNATDITTGNINFTGNLYQNGQVYTSNTSQWTTYTNGNLGYSSGNVGIGNTTPIYRLDVSGNCRISNGTSSSIISSINTGNVVEIQNNSSVGNSSIQFNDYLGNSKLFTGYSNSYNSSVLAGSSYIMSDTATSLKLIAGNKTTIPVILNASDNSVSITSSIDATDVYSGSLKVSGGVGVEKSIYFGNYIVADSILLASPTATVNGGNGTRFVVSPGILNTATPYAIGIENGNLWNSSPYGGYKWYTNTTASMQLSSGNLIVTGNVASNSISTGTINLTSTKIALGSNAGNTSQGTNTVAIGNGAGYSSQGNSSVALGANSAFTSQGANSVAIGNAAGQTSQSATAVAIGNSAAQNYQGSGGVAMGYQAGQTSQGSYAIAMGYMAGQTSQHQNSIILNANNVALNSGATGAFYVSSVRNVAQTNILGYNTTAKEVTYFSLSNITTSNLVATNVSTGVLIASTGVTTGTLYASEISLNGNLIATGDITAFGNISDKRLKNTITPINVENALDIVNKLEPVTFVWKDSIANVSRRGTKDVGFIAQEVENIIPYAVSEFTDISTNEIFKNIKHERIIPYLVGAIQKLTKQIKDLQDLKI